MKTLVVDDNEKARIALISDIGDYCEHLEIVGEAGSVAEAFKAFVKLKPELVFLDIKMGDGTGFDFLEKLKTINVTRVNVIFTTAYDEFAIQAFKYAAIDYLLKPVSAEDLMRAVNRLQPQQEQSLNLLLDRFTSKPNTKLALVEQDRIHMVDLNDIIRMEADKNYTSFTLTNGNTIVVSKTMKHFEETIKSDQFLRVHHAHLVNINHIKQFVKIDGAYLLMSDKSNVPVSARKKDAVMKRLKGN